MAEFQLETPFGSFELRRGSTPAESPLRAWSAADELSLEELGTSSPGRLLVVNDGWGALTVPLARWKPVVWGDSALARTAIDANLERNGLPRLAERAVPGHVPPGGHFDTVVLAVPKSTALLDWQCRAIAGVVDETSRIVVEAMTRNLPRSAATVLERHLGDVSWRPTRRKARLLDVRVDRVGPSVEPAEAGAAFVTDEGVRVFETPGVFSSGHLDVGTALLLDELARAFPEPVTRRVADLGSGNGVIAATLGRRWPDATFDLLDVSDLAGVAGRATWLANHGDPSRARFLVADGFPSDSGRYDLVVTNPPFHQGHAEDRGLTDRLLGDAAAHLGPDGRLVVVAQRHRQLHRRLRRWFEQVETVSAHPSHVVLVASIRR